MQTLSPQGHNHPTPHFDTCSYLFGNRISKQTRQGQRKNNIHEHLDNESTRSDGVVTNIHNDMNHNGTLVVFSSCII